MGNIIIAAYKVLPFITEHLEASFSMAKSAPAVLINVAFKAAFLSVYFHVIHGCLMRPSDQKYPSAEIGINEGVCLLVCQTSAFVVL